MNIQINKHSKIEIFGAAKSIKDFAGFKNKEKLQRINSLSHSKPEVLKTSVLSGQFLGILKIQENFQSLHFRR